MPWSGARFLIALKTMRGNGIGDMPGFQRNTESVTANTTDNDQRIEKKLKLSMQRQLKT